MEGRRSCGNHGGEVAQGPRPTSTAGPAEATGTEDGFTLLEVVCVVAIISIVAAIILPAIPHGTPRARIEAYAPGFSRAVRSRHVMGPHQLEAHDGNLVGGAINGGTSSIHQQLVFRPTPGLGRPETPVAGLYLASASAHPGGAVHGACGANAARAALRAAGPVGRLQTAGLVAGQRRIMS